MNIRLVTLWLAILSGLASATGVLTTFLDSFGAQPYVSYVLTAIGAAGLITTQALYIFDIKTVPLDAGTIRVLSMLNVVLGSAYGALATIVATLPAQGRLGRIGLTVVLAISFLQAVLGGILHFVDAKRNTPAQPISVPTQAQTEPVAVPITSPSPPPPPAPLLTSAPGVFTGCTARGGAAAIPFLAPVGGVWPPIAAPSLAISPFTPTASPGL